MQAQNKEKKITNERHKEEQMAELMKQFNEALKAGKYPEAIAPPRWPTNWTRTTPPPRPR